MADNNYIIQLKAALDKAKSEKQINQDLKAIEKNIRQLNLVASLYKGDSKKQLDSVIAELESKVQVVKLRTKFDQKQTQKEVGEALNNVSVRDIKINEQGIALKARKIYNILDSVISKHTISPVIEWKKEKLQKELQDFLNQNTKIQGSPAFKKQAEEVEESLAAINNPGTLDDATKEFQLFKSEARATGYASTPISDIFTGISKNAGKLADKLGLVSFGMQKFKESIGTLKDMSVILDDISKASNITQKDLKQLANNSFQIAGKYGKSGTSYLESVREMARSGYGDNSKEMGELSLLTQSAGEMTANLANSYLLATDSAYKYSGQVEKLTAALDGANNVSDKNNISLTEIAEASRISASDASKAGVSIDQLTAAEAAMISVTKGSGSEIGESFQSVLLHLQKVKGEFNGEIIDDAQIQKVENRCRELGVQLETIGQNGTKLREPMDILKELSGVYRTLPDGSDQKQGLLADLGGKHADSLSALLDNWDLYEKMLSDFSQGGGSALKETAQEADSWEGRIVSLQNSWDSLVNSLTNQDYVKGGISFLDNAIQGFEKLTDTIGAIPVLLTALNTALVAKKSDYGITQIVNPDSGEFDIQGKLMGIDFTAIKNQKKQFEEASVAINKWKEQLNLGKTDIDSFGDTIVKNNSHLKTYLSTCSKEAPPSLEGYQSYLTSAGIATDALRLKTVLLNSAISFGIGVAIQFAIEGITKFIQKQNEIHLAASKAAENIKSLSDELKSHQKTIDDSAERFAKLAQGVDMFTGKNNSLNTSDYQEFLQLSNELANIFPTLSRTYDKNGNAIVQLSGNVDNIVVSLQNLMEAQRNLANAEIADELPTVFKDAAKKSNSYKKESDDLKKQKDELVRGLENVQSNDFTNNLINGISNKWFSISNDNFEVLSQMRNDYEKLLKESNIQVDPLTSNYKVDEYGQTIPVDFTFNIISSDEDIENAKKTIEKNVQSLARQYEEDIADLDAKITIADKKAKSNWSSLGASIAAWLSTDSSYKIMSDSMQTSVQQIINNLDWSSLNFTSWDDAEQYIQDNIIALFEGADGSKINNQFEKAFNLKTQFQNGDITLDKYLKGLSDFKASIGELDAETKNSIDFIFDIKSSDGSNVNDIIKNVESKLQADAVNRTGELSLGDLEIASAKIDIPEGTLLSWEKLLELIDNYKASTRSAPNFTTMFSMLPIDTIEKYVTLLNSDGLNKDNISSFSDLSDVMSKTKTGAEDAVNAIKEYANGFTLSTDLISGIQDEYNLLQDVNEQYEKTGKIGSSSLEAIAKQYPQLRSAVNEYILGLTSADEIMSQLQAVTDDEAEVFRSAMAYRMSGSEDFFTTVKNNNQSLFSNLSKAYELDVSSWKTMAQAKAEIDQTLIKNLSNAWIKYYNIVFDPVSGLASISGGKDYSHVGSQGMGTKADDYDEAEKAREKAWSEANKQVNTHNQIIRKLNEAANIEIEPFDFDGIGSGKSGSDKKDTTKQINWIERGTKVLQDEYAKLKELANKDTIAYLGLTQEEFDNAKSIFDNGLGNTIEGLSQLQNYADKTGLSLGELYTMIQSGAPNASKENALQSMLKMQSETLLPQYQREVETNSKSYADALKAIPSEYKDKIENGGEDIESLPSDLAEKVQTAIDANEKLKSSEKQLADGEAEHIDTIKKLHEGRIDSINIENEKLEQSNKIIKSQMELMEAHGEIVGADFYERQIKNNKGLISGNQQDIAEWESEMADLRAAKVSTSSKDYKELQAKVKSAKNEIQGLKLEQEECNKTLEQMPIDNLNTVISMYKDISAAIENWGAVYSATGQKLNADYYQTLISNGATTIDQYKELASEIENVMDDQEEGSTRWNELYGQLQSVNSEMSSMVQNLQKWNEELLNMPLERISSYSSDLQKVADGLSNVKSEYDTVISAVTGALNDQIDAINKQKDAVNEEYEASKNALQDKLDLLNKQNNELKLQQKYEQSLYNLQKVNQQATEKVIRDGQIVYEQDSDKLREAQEAFQDAKFDLETSQIQTQIDDLQETLDGLNEKYQDQIDSLQKISDKWSEISDKITQVQNEAKASEVLGKDWKDKVLSGNDTDIFNNFSGMYTDISNQLIRYQEQIDTTNNIYSLLEDYIASYKDGSLSYGEALTGINSLLSQMNQKMLAGDNLKNIYDYLGAVNGSGPNANDILASIQQGLTASASELVKSLEQYNKNSGMISEYTSSWQKLTNNVSSMLDVLREVRDNLENASDEDDDDDGDDNADGEPYMGGPRVESGPGVPLINSSVQVQSLKSGIENGLVGSSTTSNREAKMKLLGLKKLDSDELAAILHKKEAVFNPDQQDMLLTNLSKAWNYIPTEAPYYTDAAARAGQPVTKFEFGDINIQKCDNVDALAQGILNGGLRSAMIQQAGIR
ncbi:MAG: hypothetical protein QM683_16450 [Lacrimispora sp.]